MTKNKKGFTLIELLVVIAIIGLLSTLAVVALNNARQKSRDARRVSDIKQIQTALELYFNDVSLYPIVAAGAILGDTAQKCFDEDGFVAACDVSGTTYMAQVPSNPSPENDGNCPGAGYSYDSDDGSTYRITFCLGGVTGGIPGGSNQHACESGIYGCTAP